MTGEIGSPTPHRFELRVYYEDTDLAGIVYHANYLKFIERGRSEWVRAHGVDQIALRSAGTVFAVRRMVLDWLRPAVFADLLTVETRLMTLGRVRIALDQRVMRRDALLLRAEVELVCMTPEGRAQRVPDEVRAALATL